MRRPCAMVLVAIALACATQLAGVLPAAAQNSRETERKLQQIKRELQSVAAERRKIEGERGAANRELRAADEKVAASSRRLREIELQLADEQASLESLHARRADMQQAMQGQREELAVLLRAAHAQGGEAPLKVLLSQDSVAEAQRVLTWHRYLQQDRVARVRELTAGLEELDAVERDITARQQQLQASREALDKQLVQLQADRRQRAELVAGLDSRYRDRRAREQALGRDAKGLEQLLTRLRAAAARAEAERRAAAERAARADGRPAPTPATVALGGPQVGGVGWPLTGALLAGYGARMPDGRKSDGLLLGANAGTAVKAVADGQVVYAEWMTGYGLLLIVDHGSGYMSLYAHNDALLKEAGDRIRRGDTVATVGNSGGHGRPALYFELRRNGQPVNPSVWLKR
ncbi:murein hydrolase activator EnvC family protein [Marilutibacter alkalisoli]|uniref:Peptidoglycan DD-metalloendopeptidase family protein n=1 Tax=Marilutibacter alkalisoli TaxID=2591633 RepID=A0A514BNB1_9GAMM|nr:peptidoglycan DD-metalloendopeptidase family protein [Lysobacter alkalisoli]QDH68852.1 peptidoglycan DD-metalloendopeptidase family protein [Lysobacter alkalisoli]